MMKYVVKPIEIYTTGYCYTGCLPKDCSQNCISDCGRVCSMDCIMN
ncbi:MAG: Clo7bot family Cys-rich peptide [Clostridia bacterium]|nr:Clo7bot family Cys-rich peptide [Clostridia bacterium]